MDNTPIYKYFWDLLRKCAWPKQIINLYKNSWKYLASQKKLIYKLLKSLYGLKQVEKLYNKIIIKFS